MLKILYALDRDNKFIEIKDAIQGSKYFCPRCQHELIIKDGPERRKHFSHISAIDNSNCPYAEESPSHIEAKEKIAIAVNKHLAKIKIERICKQCGFRQNFLLPEKVFKATLEQKVTSLDSYIIVDVLLTDQFNNPVMAVEIYESNKLDNEKKAKLKNARLPTIEIKAFDAIRDNLNWLVFSDIGLKPLFCRCENEVESSSLCSDTKELKTLFHYMLTCNKTGKIKTVDRCYNCKFYIKEERKLSTNEIIINCGFKQGQVQTTLFHMVKCPQRKANLGYIEAKRCQKCNHFSGYKLNDKTNEMLVYCNK